MRSVFCDRAEPIGAQQAAAGGPRIPQACIGRAICLAVQMPFEDQREQAGAGETWPIVWSSAIWRSRIVQKSQHGASTARSPESGIAVSIVPKPFRPGA